MDKERFIKTTDKILHKDKQKDKIGLLAEKNIHSIIKYYLEQDDTYHEIKVGSFYADILKDNHIYEIQTRSFDKLRSKLDFYLKDYDVTIVYPVDHKKWILWINKDDGSLEEKNLSKRSGNINLIFKELYKIKLFLDNPRLHLKILLIDLEEIRILDGYSKDLKKGSTKINKYPLDLFDEVDIITTNDYRLFLSNNLSDEFTSREYAKCCKIRVKEAQIALNVLSYLEIVKRIGKEKNKFIYQINK